MELKQITIQNYNSIKTPQTLLVNNTIATLLGKNGSGKSNVLKALNYVFNFNEIKDEQGSTFEIVLELSSIQLELLNNDFPFTYLSPNIKIKLSKDSLNQPKFMVGNNKVIKNYRKYKSDSTFWFLTIKESINVIRGHYIDANNKGLLKEIDLFLKELNSFHKNVSTYFSKIIVSNNIDFGKIAKKSLSILSSNTFNFIISTLKNNSALNEQISKLEKEYHSYINLNKKLLKAFSKEKSTLFAFIDDFLKTRCFYLDNEQSLLIKNTTEELKDSKSAIITSFFNYCSDKKKRDYQKENIDFKNMSDIRKKEYKKDFNHFINDVLPRFDVDMYNSLKVEIEDDNLVLYVIEKNGDIIDFDSTSLGRRWYFTYLFVKNTLKAGDVFIIDEPASFLHPEAQKTILYELEELVRKGVIVFIATHSPYMISSNFSDIFFISMTTKGTTIEKSSNKDFGVLQEIIGDVGFNHLLLNINKKYIIVEGQSDLACIKAFIRIFNLDESRFEVWFLEGAYNIKLINRFLLNNRINHIYLLDYDMRKNFKAKPSNVIFVGKGTKEKSIEGLFAPKDRKRYFRKDKLAHDKIISASRKTIEEETYNNFMTLFKEMQIL